MNYPVWDVPLIGGSWVIGGIAIFHVMISHFAIGGGFYLPMAEHKALREGREDWMEHIRHHARFFLILTSAFGAVSGVGIWFSIGLANPEGTSTLIHNFVFGWAIEWAFFIVEIAAAIVYYYSWGRTPPRLHLIVGWVYAVSAWMSLVVINGILTFMLTPGEVWLAAAGSGTEGGAFWRAFFNPTYWPSVLLRTLACIALAGVWAFVTASQIQSPQLKAEVMRWSTRWLTPAFFLMPFAFAWYLSQIPEARLSLLQLGVSNIGLGTFTQVTRAALVTVMTSATVLAVVYFLAYRNPRDFSFGHACAVLLLALGATAATEYSREMLRKPFVVGDFMYSNGIRMKEVDRLNEAGYLSRTPWARSTERSAWSATPDAPHAGRGEQEPLRLAQGALMFRGQCMSCHTVDGYRSMRTLMRGRDRQAITNILAVLHEHSESSPYRAYMPPLAGTAGERAALAVYLDALINPQAHATVAAALPETEGKRPAN